MKALFVSRSVSRAGWYRVVMPSMFLGEGHDWAAIDGDPPSLNLISSWVGATTVAPDLMEYDVVVLEQVQGRKWANLIRKLKAAGVKVLYEIDDNIHGIRQLPDHDFRAHYTKDRLKRYEECMRVCDGMIVSTEYLAELYKRFTRDRPIWVCENGLDMGRYRLTRPPRGDVAGRETVTIMWAGATGHQLAMLEWLDAIREVMRRFPHVSFVSIGQNFANLLHEEFPDRVIFVPFTTLASYPGAMMLGDVALAPVGRSEWARAKSTLRAMESAALGIPVVADRHYESAVNDGETGLVVDSPHQVAGSIAAIVEDDERRREMSDKARELAQTDFSMEHRVHQWRTVLDEVCPYSLKPVESRRRI